MTLDDIKNLSDNELKAELERVTNIRVDGFARINELEAFTESAVGRRYRVLLNAFYEHPTERDRCDMMLFILTRGEDLNANFAEDSPVLE